MIFKFLFSVIISCANFGNFNPGFFLTPLAEKTKTQAKNSTFWRTFPPMCITQEKTKIYFKKFLKTLKFSKGWIFLCHFY